MTKKPKWWWRTLACIPYLMPLHETWMYAGTAYHLHPFFEDFKFLTYPFLGFIGRLPSWFLMAYFFAAYLGVIGTMSRWMPLAVYWGKIGMHFCTAVAFGYLFTVLESMRFHMTKNGSASDLGLSFENIKVVGYLVNFIGQCPCFDRLGYGLIGNVITHVVLVTDFCLYLSSSTTSSSDNLFGVGQMFNF
ncbi:hypothetical protein C4D60_Mb06t19350 [Musa balbisiana]|uniref:Protein TIC 20 n=1 Tax=Musa balbisiana TaxID=52838 RepID=A0A4V4H407_MUSBA|nr:hypothetical protein C4D60_Mb06t19350 [Musa balbisiana]